GGRRSSPWSRRASPSAAPRPCSRCERAPVRFHLPGGAQADEQPGPADPSVPLSDPAMPSPRPRIVALPRNMGAGKSSLVEWLRQPFGMAAFFEPNEENPYLSDFYTDMRRWAMSSQLFFLVRRFQIHREVVRRAQKDPRPVVQDRTLYEDAEVFAAHLHQAGYIDARDWTTYQDLYRTLREEIRAPDLMIYLRCPLPTLTRRIR